MAEHDIVPPYDGKTLHYTLVRLQNMKTYPQYDIKTLHCTQYYVHHLMRRQYILPPLPTLLNTPMRRQNVRYITLEH